MYTGSNNSKLSSSILVYKFHYFQCGRPEAFIGKDQQRAVSNYKAAVCYFYSMETLIQNTVEPRFSERQPSGKPRLSENPRKSGKIFGDQKFR